MPRIYYGILCFWSLFGPSNTSWAAPAKKPWTFMVYLAAANNLSPFALADLQEMTKVGSNSNVNVIVYLTIFNDNGSKSTKRLYIQKGSIKQIGQTTKEDSGNVQTLIKALTWMTQSYPADHYCVDLWNHGSGILNRFGCPSLRAICYDDDTGHFLTDRDCIKAFVYAKNILNHGNNIDIVAIDACLMNMIEFAYTLNSCTNYMVGSETTIPGDGYEYARILNAFTRSVPTARSLAQTIVQVYQDTYAGTPDYTLSAVDQSKIPSVVANLNQIANQLLEGLKGVRPYLVQKAIQDSYLASLNFGDGTYLDLLNFYTILANEVPAMGLSIQKRSLLLNLLKDGQNLINQAIISHVASREYRDTGGLSFYFPQKEIDASYSATYWTEHNPALLQLFQEYLHNKGS